MSGAVGRVAKAASAAAKLRPAWQQSMLRIKDPAASLVFYQDKLGMTLLDRYDFPQWSFSLYFLASMTPGEKYGLKPGTPESHKYLWGTDRVTLKLTHNWGTEKEDGAVYHPGNKPKDGFGHIAFAVNDVYAASDALLAKGVEFKKKPDEGRMKGLAFAYDPDNYWVELVGRTATPGGAEKPAFALAQTMLRIKDPAKTIPFYTEQFGMTLIAERHYPKEKGDFSLYFLANLDAATAAALPPADQPEAMQFIKDELYPASVPVLELTHNHGTEGDADFRHHSGNVEEEYGRGFGHLGYLVDDVYEFCAALEEGGVAFHKKPDEGGMKGLAFCLDPDGYWIEIIKRGQAGDFDA